MSDWKNNRPFTWENPYKARGDCFTYQEVEPAMNEAYEAGADAILEALEKQAIKLTKGQIIMVPIKGTEIEPVSFGTDGYLIFIPEESN